MRTLEQPKVYLIGSPQIDTQGMVAYLSEVGGEEWARRVFKPGYDYPGSHAYIPPAEGLIEFMGRLCYKSWDVGLNANVTKIREDRGDYLLNVLKSGHGSILAHAWFNFVIRGGSRVFTAEMNRHAVGTAISEQSLRYVRLDDIEMWLPPGQVSDESLADMRRVVEEVEATIGRICDREFTPEMDFGEKKRITSFIRRIAPLGLATEEGWSGNIRAIRHVIEMRTERVAEIEIRIICDQIAQIMQKECPALFGDYIETEVDTIAGEWTTPFRKV